MAEPIPQEYLDSLNALNASDIQFFERDLLDHLEGIYALLNRWKADHDLVPAGLFHAVYLTDFFSSHDPNPLNRGRIRDVIGESSEKLVYNYCVMDRRAFVSEEHAMGSLRFHDTYLSSSAEITKKEDRQLVELIWANSIEQVQKLTAPKEEFKPLVPLFEASRQRVGGEALAEYQSLI